MIKTLHLILSSQPKKTKRSIYQAIIQLAVTYGSEVWVTDEKLTKDFSQPK